MPRSIGVVVSADKATLIELQTVYGLGDLHDLLEIILVDSHNQRVANEKRN
ncbi:MAG: transcription elongation factor GreA [Paraburkholderia tropica]|nr:transcription elongation factor GreA [Paraburkholderia tropica]